MHLQAGCKASEAAATAAAGCGLGAPAGQASSTLDRGSPRSQATATCPTEQCSRPGGIVQALVSRRLETLAHRDQGRFRGYRRASGERCARGAGRCALPGRAQVGLQHFDALNSAVSTRRMRSACDALLATACGAAQQHRTHPVHGGRGMCMLALAPGPCVFAGCCRIASVCGMANHMHLLCSAPAGCVCVPLPACHAPHGHALAACRRSSRGASSREALA